MTTEVKTILKEIDSLLPYQRSKLFRCIGDSNTKLSDEEFLQLEGLIKNNPLLQDEAINFLKVLVCNPQNSKTAALIKSTIELLSEGYKLKMKSSL